MKIGIFILREYFPFLAIRREILAIKTKRLGTSFSLSFILFFCFAAFSSLSYGGSDNENNTSKNSSAPSKNTRPSPSKATRPSPPKKQKTKYHQDTSSANQIQKYFTSTKTAVTQPPSSTTNNTTAAAPSSTLSLTLSLVNNTVAESSSSIINTPIASTSADAPKEGSYASASSALNNNSESDKKNSEEERKKAEEGLQTVALNIYLLKEQEEPVCPSAISEELKQDFNNFPWQFISENKHHLICASHEVSCFIDGQLYSGIKNGEEIYIFQETGVRQTKWPKIIHEQAKKHRKAEKTNHHLYDSDQYKEPKGVIIFVKKKIEGKDRFFAITLGTTGRFILNLDECDPAFGKHYAYNTLSKPAHKAVAFAELALDKKKFIREQAKLCGKIILSKKVRAFVPKELIVATDNRRHVCSFRGLHICINRKLAFETIGELCQEALEIAERQDYQQDYRDIDRFTPLEDKDAINKIFDFRSLDEYYIELPFAGEETANIQPNRFELTLSPLRSRKHLETTFAPLKENYEDFELLAEDLQKFIQKNRSNPELLKNLKKLKIIGVDHSGHQVGNWRADQLITASIENKEKIYWIENGEVFEVDPNFITRINEELNAHFQPRSTLDPQSSLNLLEPFNDSDKDEKYGQPRLSENAYNSRIEKNNPSSFLLCDGENIAITNDPGSTKGKVEPCDLLSKDGDLIHVKRWSHHSSNMSHLAIQALSSAEALTTNKDFRNEFIRKVRESISSDPYKHNFSAVSDLLEKKEFQKNLQIVLAFIHKNAEITPANLPFTAKLALYKALAVEKLGFKCVIINIKDETKEDTNKQKSSNTGKRIHRKKPNYTRNRSKNKNTNTSKHTQETTLESNSLSNNSSYNFSSLSQSTSTPSTMNIYYGEFRNNPVKLEENNILGDGNCGFTGLGLDRNDSINKLISQLHNPEVAAMVFNDVQEAFRGQDLPPALMARVQHLADQIYAQEAALDKNVRDLNDHYMSVHNNNRLSADDMIKELERRGDPDSRAKMDLLLKTQQQIAALYQEVWRQLNTQEALAEFLREEFVREARYLSYVRNHHGTDHRGTMYALAHINNLEVHIWTHDGTTLNHLTETFTVPAQTPNAPTNVIHLHHTNYGATNALNHFNLLTVTQLPLEIGRVANATQPECGDILPAIVTPPPPTNLRHPNSPLNLKE